eukprot:m.38432 g.38432  ORF g.38432 m.38432 type:complete len:126 (-) comp9435_c0_seq2:1428-1805(-)
MADKEKEEEVDVDIDEEEVEEPAQPLPKTAANVAAEASKVTDFAQEREDELDEASLKQAMAAIGETAQREQEAKERRKKELQAVVVSKADIKLVATEMEVDETTAENLLREHGGELSFTFISFYF